MSGRTAKRICIEYDDRSRTKLDEGLVCWFGGDGNRTYAASYELIGLAKEDLKPLAFSIIEMGAKILLSEEV